MVELANGLTKIIRYVELKDNKFPIFDMTLSPYPNSWDGVSIPDLVEDKQRGMARVINNALRSIETNQDPRYVYNTDVIKDKRSLIEWKFNKYIPVRGSTRDAISPIQKDVIKAETQWILDYLKMRAETVTATSEITQGQTGSGSQTATEIAMATKNVDTRYSLISKIIGWQEKSLWIEWYNLYKRNYKNKIDQKLVMIRGIQGETIKEMGRENIITPTHDPDVYLESEVLSEAKRMNKLRIDTNLMNIVANVPEANVRFLAKEIAKDSNKKEDEINRIFPQTPDEKLADGENQLFFDKKPIPPAEVGQNHIMHLEKHAKLPEEDKKVIKHIKSHEAAQEIERMQPELAEQPQVSAQDQQRMMMQGAQPDQIAFDKTLTDQTFQSA